MTETKPERIAKVMAASGLCSRRDAEKWIEEGRVSVNGKILKTPAVTVSAEDTILVDGKPLRKQTEIKMWVYHKPAGLVTTAKDPEGRPTVFEALPRSIGRVISVGRLDLNSEGLLLLTNSGELSRKMELPSTALPRAYQVRTFGRLSETKLNELRRGITVDGIDYRPMDVEVDDGGNGMNHWLYVVIREGKNREIRRVMEAIDLQVNRLVRVGYGPFELGDLPRGAVEQVSPTKLKAFFKTIGFEG